MIDPLEAALAYVRADADLHLVVAGQIAAQHQFGDGWAIPSQALTLRLDGGPAPDLYTERHLVRLEARCWGGSQFQAGQVYRELVRITRATQRARAETGSGAALLYWLTLASGPSLLHDPDTGLNLVLVFLDTAVAEEAIP